MRTLKFIVDGQIIRKDPDCDFSGLVPGTEGYLEARFTFSKEWNGYIKAAAFYSIMGKELTPIGLTEGEYCIIPSDVCAKRTFKIAVVGQNDEGKKLKTTKITIEQNGGS